MAKLGDGEITLNGPIGDPATGAGTVGWRFEIGVDPGEPRWYRKHSCLVTMSDSMCDDLKNHLARKGVEGAIDRYVGALARHWALQRLSAQTELADTGRALSLHIEQADYEGLLEIDPRRL
jgi:hypothetical protein